MLRALDLFCGAGGATKGLQDAGFHVTGVDIRPQPHYCGDAFVQGDALTFPLDGYDLIWASPVCKQYAPITRTAGTHLKHPDQIPVLRERLREAQTPYIIENVVGAPLENWVMLCGAQFGLKTYRHRLFESNILLFVPPHMPHKARAAKCGRPVKAGEFISVVGHFSDIAFAKRAMGIDWMPASTLSQAIPPAYSAFLGRQVVRYLEQAA